MELAKNDKLSRSELKTIEKIIEARQDELRNAWQKHFNC
ncbi:DUF4160 domain-containing protein [Synechocystis salina]